MSPDGRKRIAGLKSACLVSCDWGEVCTFSVDLILFCPALLLAFVDMFLVSDSTTASCKEQSRGVPYAVSIVRQHAARGLAPDS